MSYATVSKHRGEPVSLYYEIHGNGSERILFIMGLATTSGSWENQVEQFGRRLGDEFTALIFDNRGVGLSSAPSGPYRTSEMARDTLELLEYVGWTSDVGKIHLVGISMGGMISQEVFLLAPHLFCSIALISTHAGGTIPPTNAFTMMPSTLMKRTPDERVQGTLEMLYPPEWLAKPWEKPMVVSELDGPADFKVRCSFVCLSDCLLIYLFFFQTNREWMTHRYLARARKVRPQPMAGMLGQLAAVGTHYVSESRLKKITAAPIPKLILTGTIDNLVRPTNSTYLAKVLEGNLVVIPGGGHALIGQCYEEVNEYLLNHFRSAKDFQPSGEHIGAGAVEAIVEEAEAGRKVMVAGTVDDMAERSEQIENQKKSYLPGLNLETFW